MSQWTHINAVIRFDGILNIGGLPDLGNTCTSDSPDKDWDKCNVPKGSEGSMQYHAWTNPSESSVARHTVMFWGDLRDYSNDDEILDYFKKITNGQMVRSGILEIDIEGSTPNVFQYERESKQWQLLNAE